MGLRLCLDLDELRCAALLPSSCAADVASSEESDCERRDVEASRLLKKKYEYEGNICYTR